MVQAIWQPRFIDSDFFDGAANVDCKILNAYYVESEVSNKKELQIEVIGNGMQRKLSIYGDNCKKLIDNFGSDTDKWLNKKIRIELVRKGDKNMKVLHVLEQK